MAAITLFQRECDGRMAYTAELLIFNIIHGEYRLSSFATCKNLRMADLASVPSRVLFVREDYVIHPAFFGLDREVLYHSSGRPLHRYSFDLINGIYKSVSGSFFPVYPVTEFGPGELRREFGKVVLRFYILPLGVAPFTALHVRSVGGTGIEDNFAFVFHFPVVARSAK